MSAEFIKMVSEIHSQRYAVQIGNLIASKTPCGLFYGFMNPESAAANVTALRNSGLNITCLCVLDSSYQNGGGAEVPVVTLEEFPNSVFKARQILCMDELFAPCFREYFARHEADILLLKNSGYLENIYNFYMQHLTELYGAYEIFSEEESRKAFIASIKGKLTQRVADFHYAPEPQYFLEGFLPGEGDIAIDGGAYLGETARDFIVQGAQVYSFEMDKANYETCLACAEKYGFTIENLGLSNREGEENYYSNVYASRKGFGDSIARFIDLDTYVDRKNLPRVDYIKLDIEGAELDMLRGAAKTIARWKPKMAVSAYHKPEDLWTLVGYIKSIRPDYEFKFRHYGSTTNEWKSDQKDILKKFVSSQHVPTEWEMVLYCR